MKVMPAHRARMVDAGSALVVSGGDKSGWNSGWPGMGEPTRMVKGLDSEVWVRESQGVPKAQEAPFDPIPSGGRHSVALFLVCSPTLLRDLGCFPRPELGSRLVVCCRRFAFPSSYGACETFAILRVRENVFIA